MQDEVFYLKDYWRICFSGVVPTTTWNEKGPAQAQLDLLRTGYSVLQQDGTIKHVGASERAI